MRFAVTSLSTGLPVAGARVRVEATLTAKGDTSWMTLAEGTSSADGSFVWRAPGLRPEASLHPATDRGGQGRRPRGLRRHPPARTLRRQPVVEEPRDLAAVDRGAPGGPRQPAARARAPLHRETGVPPRGRSAHQGLPAHPGGGPPASARRRGLGGGAGTGRPGLALSGLPHRGGQLLPQVPGEGPAHGHLHRPLRGQGPQEQLRERGLPGGGLPDPAVRGAAPRPREGEPRPGLRRLPHRELLRGRPGGRPAHPLAGDAVSVLVHLQEARGLPLQLRRALLGRGTLPVDPAPREGRRHEPGGRGQGQPEPDHRAHRRAADLRGRGHGDRSGRPDGDGDAHRARPASLHPRPQGAALPRARYVHRRADARGRPRRRARGGARGHRSPAPSRVALAPAGQRLHRRHRPLHHGHGRREGPGNDGQEREGPARPEAARGEGRGLRGRARVARPPRPRPGGERRSLRRRRPARGLAQAGHPRVLGGARPAPLRPRSHRLSPAQEPVPGGPRALHRGGARGQPLLVDRHRERRRHLQAAHRGPLHPAHPRALPADAGPLARHRPACPATTRISASPPPSRPRPGST